MRIKSIYLENFRNIEAQGIEFVEGINVLAGKNAQGKTNVLEAINFCSCLKSFRAVKEEQLIRFGCDCAKIRLDYVCGAANENIEIEIYKNQKKLIRKNGITQVRLRDIMGSFFSVIFTPDHLEMIKNGPHIRREFIDMALCSIDIKYTDALLRYKKILKNRNFLLKRIKNGLESDKNLMVWDMALAKEGAYIAYARYNYINSIDRLAGDIYSEIIKNNDKIKLVYINQFSKESLSVGEYEQRILTRLNNTAKNDILAGLTESGVHKDDLLVLNRGKSLKFFGSQGQIRSGVLALILAQSEHIYNKYSIRPVILLDDIMSELDSVRQKFIFNHNEMGQIILSTCELMKIRNKGDKKIRVKDGRFY